MISIWVEIFVRLVSVVALVVVALSLITPSEPMYVRFFGAAMLLAAGMNIRMAVTHFARKRKNT